MAGKIAVYGGSFNPIHLGHINVALYAMEECALEKVIFLPNATPPHKAGRELISAHHRYNMVTLATEDYPQFEISDYEMNLSHKSYTIDTMRHMQSLYDSELYFIIGADSLYTLDSWKSYDELIKECRFIVADRNCAEGTDIQKAAKKVVSQGGDITFISMPRIDITSTMIRDCISCGEDVSSYLPDKVFEYIQSNNLYKSILEDKR